MCTRHSTVYPAPCYPGSETSKLFKTMGTSTSEFYRNWLSFSTCYLCSSGYGQQSFKLVGRCHQFLCGFLANDHLPRVSHQSHLSANGKGTVQKFHDIYLRAEGNPGKPQLGDLRWRLCDHHRLKWAPFPSNEVGRIAQHLEKERKELRVTVQWILFLFLWPVAYGAMGYGKKGLKQLVVWQCHLLLSGFLANGH